MLTFTLGKLLCLLRKFKSVSTHMLDKTRNVSVISHLSANHVPSLTASIICYIQNSHISQQFLPWCVISFTAEIMSLHISRKNMHCNLLRNLTRKRCEFIIFYCTITWCLLLPPPAPPPPPSKCINFNHGFAYRQSNIDQCIFWLLTQYLGEISTSKMPL